MHDFAVTQRQYAGMVSHIAGRRTRDGSYDAEDMVQDIWLSIWQQWDSLRTISKPLGGIIARCAHQVCSWQWRQRMAVKRSADLVPMKDEYHDSVPPEQHNIIELQQVIAVISDLPPIQRDAMQEAALGSDNVEIGQKLGVSKQAIAQRITLARATLYKKGHRP